MPTIRSPDSTASDARYAGSNRLPGPPWHHNTAVARAVPKSANPTVRPSDSRIVSSTAGSYQLRHGTAAGLLSPHSSPTPSRARDVVAMLEASDTRTRHGIAARAPASGPAVSRDS